MNDFPTIITQVFYDRGHNNVILNDQLRSPPCAITSLRKALFYVLSNNPPPPSQRVQADDAPFILAGMCAAAHHVLMPPARVHAWIIIC